MNNIVTYLVLRCVLGYTNDQQLHQGCHCTILVFKCAFSYLDMSMFNSVMRCNHVCLCVTMVYKLTKVYTNDT